MMIKHTLSLSIDNSNDDWICVHTPIPDYQMAYHINKVFSVRLRRRPKDYASQKSSECFPIFSYQRRKKGVHWHLIRNKVETSSPIDTESLLFSCNDASWCRSKTSYCLSLLGTKREVCNEFSLVDISSSWLLLSWALLPSSSSSSLLEFSVPLFDFFFCCAISSFFWRCSK